MNTKIIVAVVVVLVGAIYWFGIRPSDSAPMPVTETPAAENESTPTTERDSDQTSPAKRSGFSPAGWAWADEDLQPIETIAPSYPRHLREAGIESDVIAAFNVLPDGTTADCKVVEAKTLEGESTEAFNESVCKAVGHLSYREIPESRPMRFKFHFRLTD